MIAGVRQLVYRSLDPGSDVILLSLQERLIYDPSVEIYFIIGGSRGRVAGVATPFGWKIVPKKVNFGNF